jgi:hypothetical protein
VTTFCEFSVFFSLPLQVKPQKRKELCDGREGQTAYYVERKALRCGARKATLIMGGVAFQCATVLLSDTTANIAKKSDWGMFKPTLLTRSNNSLEESTG